MILLNVTKVINALSHMSKYRPYYLKSILTNIYNPTIKNREKICNFYTSPRYLTNKISTSVRYTLNRTDDSFKINYVKSLIIHKKPI